MTAVQYPCHFFFFGRLPIPHDLHDIQYTAKIVVKIPERLNEINAIACTNSSKMWPSSYLVQQTLQAW